MRIYITHCTGIKDNSLRISNKLITPDQLYASVLTQRFISRCEGQKVKWAIFSDYYGIWYPDIKRLWYDKHPDMVTEQEFTELLGSFDENLKDFSEIWFYNNPSWLHPLYQRIISSSRLTSRIKKFSHLKDIK
ncbi:MAG: hypothetical protein JKX73_07995 [Flavobacteriales bacterium]|nr:hypothetical protein [Flavobacteriales bacterium]